MGASPGNKSAFMVPMLVSMVAVYFFDGSMVIGGGDENCLEAEEDTAAPCAAATGEAPADGEAEADGFGSGLSALVTWAADGGLAAGGFVAAGGCAAGAAVFPPQPASSSTSMLKIATRKQSIK